MRLLVFIFLPINLIAQQLIGFEDIPFKSSKEIVIEEMLKFENVKLGYERDDVLGFQGGEYGANKVYFWSFHFFNDQLHTVDIVFRRPEALNRLREDIINYITQKYGVESLEKLDNNKNLANTWYFYNEGKNPTDLINLILYETSTEVTTYQLSFVNIKLFQKSEQQGE
ncbi:MAG: hypothetical protein P8X73_18555 [Ignavibacteriaceae bacterium]